MKYLRLLDKNMIFLEETDNIPEVSNSEYCLNSREHDRGFECMSLIGS